MRWLFGRDDLGHVHPWNPVIAERHAATTRPDGCPKVR